MGQSQKFISLPPFNPFGIALKDVSLELKSHTITAIAGVAGNGQLELGAVLSGEVEIDRDRLVLDNQEIGDLGPKSRRLKGLHFLPEKRIGHSMIGSLRMWENSFLTARQRFGMMLKGFLHQKNARNFSQNVIDKYAVNCSGNDAQAASLSGGNIQKFAMGRELSQAPKILIVVQPTWGIDVGAASLIHQELIDLAKQGTAVLMITQDLAEIFALADKVAVICAGNLSPIQDVEELSSSQLGLLMAGVSETNQVEPVSVAA